MGVRGAAVEILLCICTSCGRGRFALITITLRDLEVWTAFVAFDALCNSWLCTECFTILFGLRFILRAGEDACGKWANGFAVLVTRLAPRDPRLSLGLIKR